MPVIPDAVSVKDNLLQQLNTCESYMDYSKYTTNLVVILSNTKGFWAELGYCYKAVEIINTTIDRINAFLLSLESNQLPKFRPSKGLTVAALTFQLGQLVELRDEYTVLRNESTYLD